jgi:probable rRNA maturation factor
MINLEILEDFQSLVNAAALEQAAQLTLKNQGRDSTSELTIVITDNQQIQQLNHQFRSIAVPTDVLSFPADHTDPDSGETYLGDIIIAYPTAAAQAKKWDHLITAELQLLVIHGSLHLLGHDHANEAEKDLMWGAQAEILAQLGLHIRVERDV